MIKNKELELYFHIPFCVRKCNYCDFLSAPATPERQKAYMAALFAEVEGKADRYQDYTVSSIFIGGGTPSVVDADYIATLLAKVKERFRVSDRAEISMELNPGTVDKDKLNRYLAAGVNRLSMGLQSAIAGELECMGRIHTFETFQKTFAEAREVGFQNINVDIMSGLPGQTLESLGETFDKVLSLPEPPEHISVYSLIVEEGTVFATWEQEGRIQFPDEETDRLMYEETKRILAEAGYLRYEISNYAKPGYECRHNIGYWKRTEYAGFGIGAASLVDNTRFRNGEDREAYLDHPLECEQDVEVLDSDAQMEEFMFLGLRMTRGVGAGAFYRTFGRELTEVYGPVIQKNCADGLLQMIQPEGDPEGEEIRIALTDRGLDVSNYVMSQFLFDRE